MSAGFPSIPTTGGGLRLAPLSRTETDRVLHLDLSPDQQVFAGAIATAIAETAPTTDFHIGRIDDVTAAGTLHGLDDNDGHHGLDGHGARGERGRRSEPGADRDRIVAFFKIDRAYPDRLPPDLLAGEGYRDGDLGLRAMIVGRQFQGRGHGKAVMAALPAYLTRLYPAARHLFLTVNCRNPAAIALYARGGFIDRGTLYHGGRAGPQHLLRLDLS